MKSMKIKSLTVFTAALLVFGMVSSAAAIEYFGFYKITNNGNEDVGSQLSVGVYDAGVDDAGIKKVGFTFTNNVGIGSSITDIYFDDGTLLGIAQILNSAGVSFASPATPGDLPGGNAVDFETTVPFSADSDSPVSKNGVDAASEWVTIIFNLINGKTYADTIKALNSGELRIGLHVQSIGVKDGSDSYVNRVPEPVTLLLLGLGLVGVAGIRRFKK